MTIYAWSFLFLFLFTLWALYMAILKSNEAFDKLRKEKGIPQDTHKLFDTAKKHVANCKGMLEVANGLIERYKTIVMKLTPEGMAKLPLKFNIAEFHDEEGEVITKMEGLTSGEVKAIDTFLKKIYDPGVKMTITSDKDWKENLQKEIDQLIKDTGPPTQEK